MSDDLDRLDKLAEAATPGPWVIGDPHPFLPGAQVRLYAGNWEKVVKLSRSSDQYVEVTADGWFIAAANPKVVRALVQRVRDAVAERDAALAREAKVRELHHPFEGGNNNLWCGECAEDTEWPCATIEILNGAKPDGGCGGLPCPTIRALDADGKEAADE